MKLYQASFTAILNRFYLMMIAVVVPFLIGMPLLALIACPIFLSAMLGIKFEKKISFRTVKNKYPNTANKGFSTTTA